MSKKYLFGKVVTLFLLLTTLIFLCASVASANADGRDDKVILTKQDHGKEVKVKEGDVIQIVLPLFVFG